MVFVRKMRIVPLLFWIITLKFLKCKGCLESYTLVGSHKRLVSSYSFERRTSYSLSQCESHCSNHVGCLGYYHNSFDGCELSSSTFYTTDWLCPSCKFYTRHCTTGCFDNYTVIGPHAQGEGVLYQATVTEGQCQSLCNANGSCHGFHHNSHSDLCQLTVGYNSIPSGSSESYFHMRHCPKACSNSYTPMGGYSKGTAVFWEDTSTQTDCQNECSSHNFCMGFHYNTANSLCQLSTVKEKGLSGCSTCNFHRRACYATAVGVVSGVAGTTQEIPGISSPTTSETTTEIPTTSQGQNSSPDTPISPTQSTDKVTLPATDEITTGWETNSVTTSINSPSSNTSLVQCICTCKNTNVSLEESIERRKKELQVNVGELSSTKRKLISVDDNRPSAQALGQVGIAVLAFIGCLIVLPDIISVIVFYHAHFKK